MEQDITYAADLRNLVNETIVLGISKTTIAERAGYNLSRFNRWTNDPTINLTIESADSIRRACFDLMKEVGGVGQ